MRTDLQKFCALALLSLLCVVSVSKAEEGGGGGASQQYLMGLPIGSIFPNPSGIIFPPLPLAAGINPAALPQKNSTAAMEVTYGPPPEPGLSHNYFGALGIAGKDLGFGGGYTGGTGTAATHGAFAGMGMKTAAFAMGFAIRQTDFRDGFLPSTDLGIMGELKNDMNYGLVLYGLESSPQLDFGVGFGRTRYFKFELNMLVPPIASAFQAGSEYIITACSNVQLSFFGLFFKSSYSFKSYDINQTVGLSVWLSKNMGLAVQYSSPNRSQYGLLMKF